MTPPGFAVLGLPRSRTFWLSRFLSYGGWECGHDQVRHMRSPEDIKAWLAMPSWGTAETAAAPFWRTLQRLAPDARVVVVRRPVAEVIDSLARLGGFDMPALTRVLRGLDAKLDQITGRWPGCLSVRFADLATEATCAAVFEHCLPFQHDPAWWRLMEPINLQINMPALMRYYAANKPALDKLAATVKHQTIADISRRGVAGLDGVTFHQEPFDPFYRDAEACFAEHLVQTGQAPDDHMRKNLALLRSLDAMGALHIITARSANGLMHGYLMSIVSPSLDSPAIIEGTHTIFFASPDIPGLGLKLQRAAVEGLRARGVTEVVMRAGVRGSGPRLGTLYRRLGAEEFGQIYRLKLEA